ncbi:hypothetical protein MGYG_01199 [Nannizzia gypsea CBS 118893]|uniref:Uncharacterized protein n=1 Tax=Arthroderma gypseum (strain ATCC MYA-4604 / CBS 118893) TaxID=535722 RepID=E5QZE5_ARTGP|nr:hypothetical protein MGYG_01199 [Nannizzia gypsea CBS 118893]EFQ98163.1 hypothetical protein MGYG_01199 [Nannizzia gypsea CBS 118893]
MCLRCPSPSQAVIVDFHSRSVWFHTNNPQPWRSRHQYPALIFPLGHLFSLGIEGELILHVQYPEPSNLNVSGAHFRQPGGFLGGLLRALCMSRPFSPSPPKRLPKKVGLKKRMFDPQLRSYFIDFPSLHTEVVVMATRFAISFHGIEA